ncbi:MAG: Rieske 2Fe-2S domain-containing protein [Chloroflexi bacterium]|nr:MAG: Rieske 2Fe-2S domain-containing protein [Chloroflexota bacterium]
MGLNPYDEPRGRLHALANVTRRQFFGLMGGLGGLVALVFLGAKGLQFLFPGATGESPPMFKVDADPSAITVGNPLQITDKRVSIVRDQKGLYAVYLICTHLGCTPNYTTSVRAGTSVGDAQAAAHGDPNKGWACPCHGSRYFIDSTNFFGPAPRPMDWVDIAFAPDGKLVVDRSKLVVQRQAGQNLTPEWRLDPTSKKSNGKTFGV